MMINRLMPAFCLQNTTHLIHRNPEAVAMTPDNSTCCPGHDGRDTSSRGATGEATVDIEDFEEIRGDKGVSQCPFRG